MLWNLTLEQQEAPKSPLLFIYFMMIHIACVVFISLSLLIFLVRIESDVSAQRLAERGEKKDLSHGE